MLMPLLFNQGQQPFIVKLETIAREEYDLITPIGRLVWLEVTLGLTLQGCDVRCAQTKTSLFTSSLFLPPKTTTSTNNLFPHPPTTQSIIMQFYITVIIFLSLIHSLKMSSGSANASATTRLRITLRGFALHPLPREQLHTINNLPRPVDSFKESY
jgi:hypothetical protein